MIIIGSVDETKFGLYTLFAFLEAFHVEERTWY